MQSAFFPVGWLSCHSLTVQTKVMVSTAKENLISSAKQMVQTFREKGRSALCHAAQALHLSLIHIYSGDAAEQVVRMSLEGAEFALKITGSAAKNLAAPFTRF